MRAGFWFAQCTLTEGFRTRRRDACRSLLSCPLPRLARYIREMTESCNQAHLVRLMELIRPNWDKRSISLRVDAHPPMSISVTDHRTGDVYGLDFGFGIPISIDVSRAI